MSNNRTTELSNLQRFSSAIASRLQWFQSQLQGQSNTNRQERDCGYPLSVDVTNLKNAYLRGDIARRVVELYPSESWSEDPDIYETEDEDRVTRFEQGVLDIDEKFNLLATIERADILSGIGQFGIILLGIDDNRPLEQPVEGFDEKTGTIKPSPGRKLIYMRPFDETFVEIKEWEANEASPRYGQPTVYSIKFDSEFEAGTSKIVPTADPSARVTSIGDRGVHWTRIIHLADNRGNSDVYGMPRLEVVYNRILDLKKIVSGSAEMFWKAGWQGVAIEAPLYAPNGASISLDFDSIKEQFLLYEESFQKYIALQGAEIKTLNPGISDPSAHVEVQLLLIATALACPLRIFKGAEVGQLASGQDIIAWNKRMSKRRKKYVTPYVIRPVINRLISLGVLPAPSSGASDSDTKGNRPGEVDTPRYFVDWPDLNTPSDEDKASVAQKMTDAISKYIASGGDQVIDLNHFLTMILKFTTKEAESIAEAVGDKALDTDPDLEAQRELDKIEATASAKAAFSRNGS